MNIHTSTQAANSAAADSSSLPSPPFITVAGIPNFRDLGGYPVSPTRSVRRGLIYRCAEPSKVTEDGIKTMNRLGITHVYDLRSNPEIERSKAAGMGKVVEWEGAERIFAPVFRDEDYSPEGVAERYRAYASNTAEGFAIAYTDILNNAQISYRTILQHLIADPEKPMVVHCTAGKDRTGVLCALILSLCGVDDEVIAKEYELTEIGLSKEWKDRVVAHLMENPALKGNEKGALSLVSARASSMTAFLKVLKDQFSGAETYMVEKCGFSKEEVEKIRGLLIIEEPSSEVAT